MNGRIVNIDAGSKSLLTLETEDESGRITAVLCDLEGNPLPLNGTPIAVYLDTITGSHFAHLSHEQAQEYEDVHQGVGGVSGWFISAPDFTLKGRHGENAEDYGKSKKHPASAAV